MGCAKRIQITLVLVFILSRYWFKSIIRAPPPSPGVISGDNTNFRHHFRPAQPKSTWKVTYCSSFNPIFLCWRGPFAQFLTTLTFYYVESQHCKLMLALSKLQQQHSCSIFNCSAVIASFCKSSWLRWKLRQLSLNLTIITRPCY